MKGLGFLKELAEQKRETKEEKEQVEQTVQKLKSTVYEDLKGQMRAAYGEFLCTLDLDKNCILYESFGGRGMICNPYAIFKYLMSEKQYQKYTHVWVIDDFDDNKIQMEEYRDCGNVRFVKYQSEEYLRYLATAKYLINNVSFPGFFVKRKGQVYLNTWHGIPMKTMGFDIPGGNVSSGNSARNLLTADYLISASPYMTEKAYLESYKMRGLYEGTILENGFPRNDVFFHTDRLKIIEKLQKNGVNVDPDKKIILYAPTWKGEKYSKPQTSLDEYFKLIESVERSVDTAEYQILVKPHQIVYYHIKNTCEVTGQFVPATLDTNELLSVVDVLISDYSSIHFDFLVSGKPLIFFLPDLDEFEDYRGLYFSLDKLPGPVVKNYAQLEACLGNIEETAKSYERKYREEKSWACPSDDGNVCMRVAETLFGKKHICREVRCSSNDRKKILVYAGDFKEDDITASFMAFLHLIDYSKLDVTVLAEAGTEECAEKINSLPAEVRVLYWKPFYAASMEEFARHTLMEKRNSESRVCPPYEFYRRELIRAFGNSEFDCIAAFSGNSSVFNMMMTAAKNTKKIIWMNGDWSRFSFLYPKMDKIVACSKSAALYSGGEAFKKEMEKCRWIKNPVDTKRIEEEDKQQKTISFGGQEYCIADIRKQSGSVLDVEAVELPDREKINIAALGDFSRENHFEKLIQIFEGIVQERQDVHLYILGEGLLKEKMEKLADERGLGSEISFLGNLKYPLGFIRLCQCFVLESVMGEQSPEILAAKALGIPAVWKYSELRMTLKGKAQQQIFDVNEYNREIRKDLESLFEV